MSYFVEIPQIQCWLNGGMYAPGGMLFRVALTFQPEMSEYVQLQLARLYFLQGLYSL